MPKGDTKTKIKENIYDVAVIGSGPAGLMAACTAADDGLAVVLIEKNQNAGKKLLLTGNGRCNISNFETNLKKLVGNYNNGEFLFHAFSVFGPKQTIEFFNKLGLETKIEANNRIFPKGDNAMDVVEVLQNHLADKKVKMFFGSEVSEVVFKKNKIEKIITGNKEIKAKKYILCTGGKSFSVTGSTGFGYEVVKANGHTVIKPKPAITPIKTKEAWCKDLQGVNLADVNVRLFQNGKKMAEEDGNIVFTHFGISGPAVLNISGKAGDLLEKGETKISLDLFPLLNYEELGKGLDDVIRKYPSRTIKNILSAFVPDSVTEVLLEITGVLRDKVANNMAKPEKERIVKILKNIEMTLVGLMDLEQAMVTRGGISLDEIDHKTMKSKIIDNLFFAGEIINVDGKTGGFNLQMCWSTGYLAGKK